MKCCMTDELKIFGWSSLGVILILAGIGILGEIPNAIGLLFGIPILVCAGICFHVAYCISGLKIYSLINKPRKG